ncbi:MAG: ATP-binding protein [Bdellovibrionales bacterium]|nr:ATP-binding protein [Bdellovibrionales bacterium]
MNILAQTALLVALTSLGMALSTPTRQLQNKLSLSFSVLCGMVFVWSLSFFLEKVFGGGRFYSAHLLSGIWLGPAGLFFLRIWIGRFPQLWAEFASRALWGLSLASATILGVAWTFGITQGEASLPLLKELMYFSPAPLVLQLVLILATRRPLPLREGVVFGGALFVLAFSTMDHVSWMGHVLPSLGNLLLCVYLILVGQAVAQQKFLDLPQLITRFVVLLVLALVLTGIYLLLVSWIEKNPALFFLNSFAVSFFVVMSLNPLQRWVSALTDRLLASRDADWLKSLEQSKLDLRSARTVLAWENEVRQALENALAANQIKVVLTHRDITENAPLLLAESQQRRQSGRLSILTQSLLRAEIDRTAKASERKRLGSVLDEFLLSPFSAFLPLIDSTIKGWIFLNMESEPSRETEKPRGKHGTGINSWRQLRDVEHYLDDAARSLSMILRVRDEAERERLATLGEMAAGLAHEIRNPLGAIQGAAQLLPVNSEVGPWTQVIRDEVHRLNHVVSQFLTYSKKIAPVTAPVELHSWLIRAVERLNSAHQLSNIQAKVRLEKGPEDLIIEIDAEAIFQVLENLVRNSVQAGASEISIQAEFAHPAKVAVLLIRDNGRGISPDDFEKLFVPFFTTKPSTGTGLGLSISQRIIQSHHGVIEPVSSESVGACFRIQLPGRRSS